MPGSVIFSKVDPATVVAEVEHRLTEYRSQIKALFDQEGPITFDNFMVPLEKLSRDFESYWASISHLNDVKKTEALNEAVETARKLITRFDTELYQNKALYDVITSMQQNPELDIEQLRLVEKYLIEFRLSGVSLPSEQQAALIQVREALSEAQALFKNNKTAALDAWQKVITNRDDLKGLPDNIIAQAAQKAEALGIEGWVLTLAPGTYAAVMKHAESKELRSEFHLAEYTAASDWGPHASAFDNGPVMVKIHELKQQEAQLLGFESHVDVSLAKKMATKEEVIQLQTELAQACQIQAMREYEVLQRFAREVLGIEEMASFDVAYVAEKLKAAKYDLDDKALSEYFPEKKVLSGMFEVVNRLFGISLKEEKGFDTWDADVKLFSVYAENGHKLGEIYMDLYARPGEKRAGAWMNQCQSSLTEGTERSLPIAFLSTNFSKGDGSKPPLLTHREVQTTFHEFGHCLHHVLSQARYPSMAGPAGVPWDAVEAPSQMMENWIWHPEGLRLFSEHYETGEPLPDHLIQALARNRHFNAGINALQQLCYGIFDFRVYSQLEPHTPESLHKLWLDTFRQIQVTPLDEYNHMPNTFHHIFSGGYSAGYYVYKWALNMAYDMFSEFEANGIFDEATGRRYLHTILEPGGVKPFMELLTSFLGREPRTDALFRAIATEPADALNAFLASSAESDALPDVSATMLFQFNTDRASSASAATAPFSTPASAIPREASPEPSERQVPKAYP